MAALEIDHIVSGRYQNHKIKGVEGMYNRYHSFEERKNVLNTSASFIGTIDCVKDLKINYIAG